MADTIREGIISAMVALVEGFTFASITNPDIFRGILAFDPDVDPPPLITIIPRPESSERSQYGADTKTMQIDFSAFVNLGGANPSELGEAVLGELIAAVFSSMPTNISDIIYRSGGIDEYPDGAGSDTITVGITVDVVYETITGNPYTAA